MKWFINTFLASFGLCKWKRISEKQFKIFQKYLEGSDFYLRSEETSNTIINTYRIAGKKIRLQDSIVGYGKVWHEYYVEIRV